MIYIYMYTVRSLYLVLYLAHTPYLPEVAQYN